MTTVVVTSQSSFEYPFSGAWETGGAGYCLPNYQGGGSGTPPTSGPTGSVSPNPAILNGQQIVVAGAAQDPHGYSPWPQTNTLIIAVTGSQAQNFFTQVVVTLTGGTPGTFLTASATYFNPGSDSTFWVWTIPSVTTYFSGGLTTTLVFSSPIPPTTYPTGTPQTQTIEREPLVSLKWSDDGYTWSNPLTEQIGGTGEYVQWVKFLQLGLSESSFRVYEVTCTDPVQIDLIGASLRMTRTFAN